MAGAEGFFHGQDFRDQDLVVSPEQGPVELAGQVAGVRLTAVSAETRPSGSSDIFWKSGPSPGRASSRARAIMVRPRGPISLVMYL